MDTNISHLLVKKFLNLSEISFLSEKREDNFIAGHSMGGYGSFKIALLKPESFAAAASLSGALDINHLFIEAT